MVHDKRAKPTAPLERDLETAIGLVWGHLKARQFRQAATLAGGCLAVWPDQPVLVLLAAYADGELGAPLTPALRARLDRSDHAGLAALVLRRATTHDEGGMP